MQYTIDMTKTQEQLASQLAKIKDEAALIRMKRAEIMRRLVLSGVSKVKVGEIYGNGSRQYVDQEIKWQEEQLAQA